MSINIIERAVVPYNDSPNRIVSKEQYALYAPAAGIGKPGMAGFHPEYFAVNEQIVSLSQGFLRSYRQDILHEVGLFAIKPLHYSFPAASVIVGATNSISPDYFNRLPTEGEKVLLPIRSSDGLNFLVTLEFTDELNASDFVPFRMIEVLPISITTAALIDGCVTSLKLANRSITAEKIAPNAITTEKIASQAITTSKLVDGSISTSKIGTQSVTADKIRERSISNSHLNDDLRQYIMRINTDISAVSYDASTGILNFTRNNGDIISIDLPLELLVSHGVYDDDTQSIILVLANSDTIVIPLDDFAGNILVDQIYDPESTNPQSGKAVEQALGKLSLGLDTDGLLYIFVDGVRVGNGIALQGGAISDVIGTLDENNNIILTGDLADGTYTLKYENADGTYTEIGSLVVAEAEPEVTEYILTITQGTGVASIIVNRTSSSHGATGALTNGAIVYEGDVLSVSAVASEGYTLDSFTNSITVTGNTTVNITATEDEPVASYTNLADPTSADWAVNSRFGSGGAVSEVADLGADISNYIEFKKGDTIRVKGMALKSALPNGSACRSCFYETMGSVTAVMTSSSAHASYVIVDENGVSAITIDDAFLVGVTGGTGVALKYARIGGTLTGTKEDVIITVNEEIV